MRLSLTCATHQFFVLANPGFDNLPSRPEDEWRVHKQNVAQPLWIVPEGKEKTVPNGKKGDSRGFRNSFLSISCIMIDKALSKSNGRIYLQ
jgi:hypothetical protein